MRHNGNVYGKCGTAQHHRFQHMCENIDIVFTYGRLVLERQLGIDCALVRRLPRVCRWPGYSCDTMETCMGNAVQHNIIDSSTCARISILSSHTDDLFVSGSSVSIARLCNACRGCVHGLDIVATQWRVVLGRLDSRTSSIQADVR